MNVDQWLMDIWILESNEIFFVEIMKFHVNSGYCCMCDVIKDHPLVTFNLRLDLPKIIGIHCPIIELYRKSHLWVQLLTTVFHFLLNGLLSCNRTASAPIQSLWDAPGCVLSTIRSHHVPRSSHVVSLHPFFGSTGRKEAQELLHMMREGWRSVSSLLMHCSTMERQSIIHPIIIIPEPSNPFVLVLGLFRLFN